MDDKKFLCVLAGYDSDTEQYLSNLQKHLYEHGFSGEHTKDLPQHITLGYFAIEKETELKALVKHVAASTRAFALTLNHIAVFSGAKVLFIAPDASRKLIVLKENFGTSDSWTPHTTMLIDQPESIYQAFPLVAEQFKAFCGTIDTLYLYEFWPTRFICKEKLKI